MDEHDYLDAYNGDPVHDMYVDYTNHINTSEAAESFDDDED